MPTIMKHHNIIHHRPAERIPPQTICIVLGSAFILIGLFGVLMPRLLGMHLSMLHNLLQIISGMIALWCGLTSSNRAIAYSLWFGAGYGLLGIAGFVFGVPGYPGIGNMEADQNLFVIIPKILELGTVDHIIYLLVGAFLVLTAFTFRKERGESGKKKIAYNKFKRLIVRP
jgi:hypothetical protein